MNTALLLSALAAWWQRFTCRIQEARRYRRDMQVLASMSAHQLRDIGLSHAEVATAAYHPSRCG